MMRRWLSSSAWLFVGSLVGSIVLHVAFVLASRVILRFLHVSVPSFELGAALVVVPSAVRLLVGRRPVREADTNRALPIVLSPSTVAFTIASALRFGSHLAVVAVAVAVAVAVVAAVRSTTLPIGRRPVVSRLFGVLTLMAALELAWQALHSV